MKSLIIIGAVLITLALILYSKAMFTILRNKVLSKKDLFILSLGFMSEIIAVACMGAVSTKSIFSPHSLLGYIGAIIMLIAIAWGWKTSAKESSWAISKNMFHYYRFVYVFWVISYITGVYSATLR